MPESRRRPAHRPSRRNQLIEGAIDLFAVKPPDLVTISEIVRHVDMTPAAFYYHFSSRDELFLEVVNQFGDSWATCAEEWWGAADGIEEVVDVAGRLIDEAITRRAHATVFFVTSKGVSVSVEESRRSFTARAASAATDALRRCAPESTPEGAAVDAVALITVLESALRAELSLDPAYRTLGPRRFRDEVTRLCGQVLEARADT